MEIKNVRVYELEESILASGYPHQIGEPEDFSRDLSYLALGTSNRDRAVKLAKTPPSSGHSNFRKGILVSFDLKYTQYLTPQLQRYNWITIVSSQSKMHTLTKIKDIKSSCNKYVYQGIINIVNELIRRYNNCLETAYPMRIIFPVGNDKTEMYIENKEELFQYIISNTPLGFELWMRITSNYEQLANIYRQRCKTKHKLYDWKEFGEFIEKLPLANELIIC